MASRDIRILTIGNKGGGKRSLINFLSENMGFEEIPEPYIDPILICDSFPESVNNFLTQNITQHTFTSGDSHYIFTNITADQNFARATAFGALTSEFALIIIDAQKGVIQQTIHQCHIAATFGIRHIILAINKMDAANYSNQTFKNISDSFAKSIETLNFRSVIPIPVSVSNGENLIEPNNRMPWYKGKTMMSQIKELDTALCKNLFILRSTANVSDHLRTTIIWLDAMPMLPGRVYEFQIGAKTLSASISDLRYIVNINNSEPTAAKILSQNEIGVCNLSLGLPIAFNPYEEARSTGSFTLAEQHTKKIVALGVISFGLRRATNIIRQNLGVNKFARSQIKNQKACVLWFTGLPGSGKSTIANHLEETLHKTGYHTLVLDGDNVRQGLNRDLGFTDADRVENIRRISEVSKLFVEAGLIVLVSFISPFRNEREMARNLLNDGEFFEIFIDTPIEICEARDPKGLYKKAREGNIENFTGVDSPYEQPINPNIKINTADTSANAATKLIVQFLEDRGVI